MNDTTAKEPARSKLLKNNQDHQNNIQAQIDELLR